MGREKKERREVERQAEVDGRQNNEKLQVRIKREEAE